MYCITFIYLRSSTIIEKINYVEQQLNIKEELEIIELIIREVNNFTNYFYKLRFPAM